MISSVISRLPFLWGFAPAWNNSHTVMDAPRWLERVTASGGALAASTALATDADVCIRPRADAAWVAACMAIERKAFARHEAMDIAYEVSSVPGVTLLCASPLRPWAGREFGGSFGTNECVGYAVVQETSADSRGNPFAALEPPPSVLLSKLAVAPSLRRRGIGRALLEAAVGLARSRRHVAVVRLHVDAENAGARALYEAAGFVLSGERLDNFYRAGRHAFELVLELRGPAPSTLQSPASRSASAIGLSLAPLGMDGVRACKQCGRSRTQAEYTPKQWSKVASICIECVAAKEDASMLVRADAEARGMMLRDSLAGVVCAQCCTERPTDDFLQAVFTFTAAFREGLQITQGPCRDPMMTARCQSCRDSGVSLKTARRRREEARVVQGPALT